MNKIICFLFGHDIQILGVGQSYPSCSHLHPLADTRHKCLRCGVYRNWIHTTPERLIKMFSNNRNIDIK